MQLTTFLFAVVLACAYAKQQAKLRRQPEPYRQDWYPDDFDWQTNAGPGKVFGTLGSTDGSLFGKAGYKQDFFNDHRGHLEGTAYGARVLGANGDSSSLGAKLGWSNDNAKLSADVNREIGGRTGVTVTGEGKWQLDKNTRLEAGGNVQKTFGHGGPDVGLEASIVHDF